MVTAVSNKALNGMLLSSMSSSHNYTLLVDLLLTNCIVLMIGQQLWNNSRYSTAVKRTVRVAEPHTVTMVIQTKRMAISHASAAVVE